MLHQIVVTPATAERWPDLEALFGSSGASAGCWYMFWRLDRALGFVEVGRASETQLIKRKSMD